MLLIIPIDIALLKDVAEILLRLGKIPVVVELFSNVDIGDVGLDRQEVVHTTSVVEVVVGAYLWRLDEKVLFRANDAFWYLLRHTDVAVVEGSCFECFIANLAN